MHTQSTPVALDGESTVEHFKIDYQRDLAMTEPGEPGGRIVYDSYAYDTQEEADAALEAFFERIIEGAP